MILFRLSGRVQPAGDDGIMEEAASTGCALGQSVTRDIGIIEVAASTCCALGQSATGVNEIV